MRLFLRNHHCPYRRTIPVPVFPADHRRHNRYCWLHSHWAVNMPWWYWQDHQKCRHPYRGSMSFELLHQSVHHNHCRCCHKLLWLPDKLLHYYHCNHRWKPIILLLLYNRPGEDIALSWKHRFDHSCHCLYLCTTPVLVFPADRCHRNRYCWWHNHRVERKPVYCSMGCQIRLHLRLRSMSSALLHP